MDFYYLPGSAPCRSVQMTAAAVGVNLNLKLLNLQEKEHLTPEFIKLNPQHTIPTLVDNGFSLWESRAIMIYLNDKYGKDDSLYPKCPKKRAVINQRLYFDMGTLYQRFADYFYPQIFAKAPANPENLQKMEDGLGFLETFLEKNKYVAGDSLTLADLAVLATISSYDVAGVDLTKYKRISEWYDEIKESAPGWEINQKGAEEFRAYFKDLK